MTIDIANLRRLLAAATPGEWKGPRITDMWPPGCIGIYAVDEDGEFAEIIGFTGYAHEDARPEPDAQLICALVNAAPQLLVIAEAATAWGQTMCTKPRECTHGDHASDCDLGAAEIRLLAAVDAARKERT
jgi:hypothetical protein